MILAPISAYRDGANLKVRFYMINLVISVKGVIFSQFDPLKMVKNVKKLKFLQQIQKNTCMDNHQPEFQVNIQKFDFLRFPTVFLNKTKEDFNPVTRPWYIGKKRLLKVLNMKTICLISNLALALASSVSSLSFKP